MCNFQHVIPYCIPYYTFDAAKTVVQAFIASRLDWCNSLLYVVPEYLLQKVQSVQNTAARLLTSTRRRDHITPMLLIAERSGIEDCMSCTPVARFNDVNVPVCWHSTHLRSYAYRTMVLPRMCCSFRNRSFAGAGPRLWNTLPSEFTTNVQLRTVYATSESSFI